MDNCTQSPSGELLQAFGEFNRGDWFDCHETLEELWVGSVGEIRDFYQGMLQIAVALHHWRGGNYAGAVLLNGWENWTRSSCRVSGWLRPYRILRISGRPLEIQPIDSASAEP